MKKKTLKVVALTSLLTFASLGVASCSCDSESGLLSKESADLTETEVPNIVLSGAKTMKVGDTLTLTPHFDVSGNYSLSWASTDQSVATVDENGLVEAHDTGRTTIICQVLNVGELVKAEVRLEVRLAGEVAPEFVKATFVDYDGTVLYEDIVPNGGTPSFDVKNPQRISDSQNSYAFAGWDKDLAPITENTTYTAVYEAIPFTNFAFEMDVAHKGYKVVGYNGTSAEVEIPSTFSYRKVVGIGEAAFKGNTTITKVTLPDTIVSIEDEAFSQCSNLRTINLPLGLEKLGVDAFSYCSVLNSPLTIGPAVTEIPENCFYSCYELPSVSGNLGVKTIGGTAFANCRSLVYEFQDGLESIGRFAFQHNKVMTDIVLPDTVTWLGESVFCHCSELYSLTLPRNLETLDNHDNINGFQALTLGCVNLSMLDIADDAPNFKVEDGQALYSKDGKMLYFVVAMRNGDFEILDGCEEIGPTAFYGVYVDTLTIPASVTKIDYEAFWTSTVEHIVFETSGEEDADLTFGYQTFSDCENLKTIDIRRKITALPNSFVENATELYSVTLPDTLTKIGNSAFEYCELLVSIDIPASVTTIGQYAFAHSGLMSVSLHDGLELIDTGAFEYCDNLVSITLPNTVTELGNYAFAYSDNFESVNLPSSLTTIGNYVFRGTKVSNLVLPASIDDWGSYSFGYTDYLTSVTMEEGITEIGTSAFRESALESVVVPDTVTKIGNYAFAGCEKLTSATLSKALNGTTTSTLGTYIFQNCSALKTLTFGPGVADSELGSWQLKFGTNDFSGVSLETINFRGSEEAFKKVNFNNTTVTSAIANGTIKVVYNYDMETSTGEEVPPVETPVE